MCTHSTPPISSATLPYRRASFASRLYQLISLLVSLPLAFAFVVKHYFFFKNMTCIAFFRGSLTTRIWLALMITRLSLSAPFLPSMLSSTKPGRSRGCRALMPPFHCTAICLHGMPSAGNPLDSFQKLRFLLLQSHSHFVKIEVCVITMFPLHCVHSSRTLMIILHLFVCWSVLSHSRHEQLEIRGGLLFIVMFWHLVQL